MKVIGITGGVGAGKSSVLALLKEMCSCDIIQADLVARNIYHSGNIGFKKVVDIFGEQIVGEDGEINRPLLADIIFKNPNKRIVLNSIIHPLVKQEIINQINNHKIAGDVDYCFVEAALLIEDHYDIFMDEIWYIYVSEDERRKRNQRFLNAKKEQHVRRPSNDASRGVAFGFCASKKERENEEIV